LSRQNGSARRLTLLYGRKARETGEPGALAAGAPA
jgi:hypothetical protein